MKLINGRLALRAVFREHFQILIDSKIPLSTKMPSSTKNQIVIPNLFPKRNKGYKPKHAIIAARLIIAREFRNDASLIWAKCLADNHRTMALQMLAKMPMTITAPT
tara:strand:- start:64 stop:381 length:318 start_codon:yes stop_codon:yes gene_type:complete